MFAFLTRFIDVWATLVHKNVMMHGQSLVHIQSVTCMRTHVTVTVCVFVVLLCYCCCILVLLLLFRGVCVCVCGVCVCVCERERERVCVCVVVVVVVTGALTNGNKQIVLSGHHFNDMMMS